MSEIEYRAWLKEFKKMLPVTMIDFYSKEISVFGAYPPDKHINMRSGAIIRDLLDFDEVELMKYTGLKDKNGVNIFESDILCYERNDKKEINCVKWYPPCFILGEIIMGYCKDFEIIGNIYENKELLEKS